MDDPKLLDDGGKVPKMNGLVAILTPRSDRFFIEHEINPLPNKKQLG